MSGRRLWRVALGSCVAAVVGGLLPATAGAAVTYSIPGKYTLVVPSGVSEMTVTATGGGGGGAMAYNYASCNAGGKGGLETASFPVKGGSALDITVAGKGADGQFASGATVTGGGAGGVGGGGEGGNVAAGTGSYDGYPGTGGGGGGGASSVSVGGSPLLVAAGGGGCAAPTACDCSGGGNDGSAGDGGDENAAGAGTLTAGGAGGAANTNCWGGVSGMSGTQGQGGAGGGGSTVDSAGGGGGGGYYGGGGGAGGLWQSCASGPLSGGGGGGGSDFVDSTGSCVTSTPGANIADGSVTIDFAPAAPGDVGTALSAVALGGGEATGSCGVKVTKVTARTGPVTGETKITISGSGFEHNGAPAVTQVDFAPKPSDTGVTSGPIAALKYTVQSNTAMTAITPDVTSDLGDPAQAKAGEATLPTHVVVKAGGLTSKKTTADTFTFEPVSTVQLGDSVASGEGTLYGLQYNKSTMVWSLGHPGAWEDPYRICHDSPYSYGNVVRRHVPDATFTQLACTGANYEDGIVGPEPGYRPAELGTVSSPDSEYVKAKPDVVLVTEGADEIHFATIVTECLKNAIKHKLTGILTHLQCTASDPGPAVKQYFDNVLPQMPAQYHAITSTIEALGDKASPAKEPRIIFTSYMNPLPPGGRTCPDTWWLHSNQLIYMNYLMHRLNQKIASTITAMHDPNVGFVNLSQSFVGHTWCTSHPWDYGLSVYWPFTTQDAISFLAEKDKPGAPFHPTPQGQKEIAKLVWPEVNHLLSRPPVKTGDAPVLTAG